MIQNWMQQLEPKHYGHTPFHGVVQFVLHGVDVEYLVRHWDLLMLGANAQVAWQVAVQFDWQALIVYQKGIALHLRLSHIDTFWWYYRRSY